MEKQDSVVLCGASSYEQKYYFNQQFKALPDHIKKELQVMCVLFTEDIGGVLTLEFAPDLLESLELYYRVIVLGEEVRESDEKEEI